MPASPAQPPRSKAVLLPFLAIAALTLAFGIFALIRNPMKRTSASTLLVYWASLKTPLEKIAADYSRETGVAVELSLGGS
jgi:ABC-type molybdate transport system substrate-binding protein